MKALPSWTSPSPTKGAGRRARRSLRRGPLPEDFRKLAQAYLGEAGHFVIVNYLRKALGEETGGHISPLAAYDTLAGRFLILDVARYK
jgi:hypothetical protein